MPPDLSVARPVVGGVVLFAFVMSGSRDEDDEMLSATSHGDALKAAVEEEMNLLMSGEYQQEAMHETVGKFQERVQDRVRDNVLNPPPRYPQITPPTTAEQYVVASPSSMGGESIIQGTGGDSNIPRVIDQGTGNIMSTIEEVHAFPRHTGAVGELIS